MQNHITNNSNIAAIVSGQKNFRPDSAVNNNLLSSYNGNADKATSSAFIDTSIFASSATTADILNNALENDLIDLSSCNAGAAAKSDDLFTADIDFMNNYLKSLPDYSNMSKVTGSNQQPAIKLRENPTPKPFQNVFDKSTTPSSPKLPQKHGVSQSPQLQRKPTSTSQAAAASGRIPLSKSSSLHTFTKQQPRNNFGNAQTQQMHQQQMLLQYKETCVDETLQNKISRSTSSSSMMNEASLSSSSGGHHVKESSDFMGFMRKPSSLMNIFKKLGSQSSSSFSPQQLQQQQSSHDAKNANSNAKSPMSDSKKSISDFWRDNIVTSTQQTSPKFGWNYHKIIPQFNQLKSPPPQQSQKPVTVPSSPSAKHKIISTVAAANNNVKKMEQAKPILIKSRDSQPKKEIVQQQESPKLPSSDGNLNKSICDQEFHKHKSLTTSNDDKNASSKFRESVKQQTKEEFLLNNNNSNNNACKAKISDQDNTNKLLKSSSNSHIYMNQDDPNYFKNLHKITKSLNNATDMMVNKQVPLHKSVSNSSVPNYLSSQAAPIPPPHHLHHHAHHHAHMQPQFYFVPSSAPVHAPAFIYPAFPPPEMQIKSNIPVCYKYQLHKSSSNSSMTPATTIGFYSLADKPAYIPWPATQQQQQQQHQAQAQFHPPHIINKSSSSSCIYAKTLNQPAHLAKNNGIFARYKPILSDDDESDSEDDISKHSNASYVNNVPAPPPFGNARKHSTSSSTTISSAPPGSNNFTPFTKISSIQIPINGQLPPPFKSKNVALTNSGRNSSSGGVLVMERQEGSQQDICQRNNTAAAAVISNKSNETQSIAINDNAASLATLSVTNPQFNNNNRGNIFCNFISNPLTATQNIINSNAVQIMHQQSGSSGGGNNGVGGEQQIYTPYTKYLSDRKYFDMSVCEKPAAVVEQRRNSGTTTTSSTSCTNKSKIPMAIPKTSTMTNNTPHATLINKSTSNNDILSAFDPFFVQQASCDDQKQHKVRPNTSNKLHQLLSTVANEQWNDFNKQTHNSSDDGSDLLYNECATMEVDFKLFFVCCKSLLYCIFRLIYWQQGVESHLIFS